MTDLPDLLDMARDIAADVTAEGVVQFDDSYIQTRLAYQTLDPRNHGLLVMVDDLRCEIVAFMDVRVLSEGVVHIDQAYLYPAYRGGEGRVLYDFAEKWARDRNAHTLTLVTRKTEKEGFVQYGFKPVHLLMMKTLEG
jgi:GNAT superfamily N-acetyltransferase